MKKITNYKYLALAVAMAAVLALTGCGAAAETENTVPDNNVPENEIIVETESIEAVTESTEACVPEKGLETEAESTETMESGTMESETMKSETMESGTMKSGTMESETMESETEPAEVGRTQTAVSESEASPKAETMSYTFTDMNATMYAKNSVNVRNLPSTDGTKLGSLAKNQAVTVTGKCNETGWCRIAYNDGEAYVSNKYLSDTAVADTSTNAGTGTAANTGAAASAGTAANTGTAASAGTAASTDPAVAAAIAQYGPNIVIFDDGTIFDAATWQQLGTINDGQIVATPEDGFNRAAAEEIWSYVNAERATAGLNEIAWDENIYSFACQRAQAIVTNYSHEGHENYGENILFSSSANDSNDPYRLHMIWHNSPGHYSNYMNARYTAGACAVYVYNGVSYAVENFTSGENNAARTTREVNGQTVNVTQAEAAAIDSGNIWTASNGVVVFILDNGNLTAGDGVHSLEELQAAMDEYYSCH